MKTQTNTVEIYKAKYDLLLPQLTEHARRLTAAADARLLGYGGSTEYHKRFGW